MECDCQNALLFLYSIGSTSFSVSFAVIENLMHLHVEASLLLASVFIPMLLSKPEDSSPVVHTLKFFEADGEFQ